MAYTSHGHHIDGTTADNIPRVVARCGGPALCRMCSVESELYQELHLTKKVDPIMEIREQMDTTLTVINDAIAEVVRMAEKMGCRPEQVKDANMNLLLAPLIVAKANLLSALWG